jgi:phosphatidylglycerophosphatase A
MTPPARGPKNAIAKVIATALGAGYSPIAPGTAGTIVAVPAAWALAPTGSAVFWAVTVATTIVGIWAAEWADRAWGTHDSGRIVIDEVAGYFVTLAWVGPQARADWVVLAVAFVLFRAFDIIKPPPVRAIDRKVGGGAGVVLDDIAAGLMGSGVLFALHELGALAQLREWVQ